MRFTGITLSKTLSLALVLIASSGCCVATQVPTQVPTLAPERMVFDATHACYPSSLKVTSDGYAEYNGHRKKLLVIHRTPEQINSMVKASSTRKRVFAFSRWDPNYFSNPEEPCVVFVNHNNDYLLHEAGHCLGVTKHKCTNVRFNGGTSYANSNERVKTR